jgi:hypothetical protein
MHQQVRTSIKQASSDGSGGALGAGSLAEGSLVEVLTLLQGKNLQSAGRANRGGGGEFVFSIQHDDGDDTADTDAREILKAEKYKADVYAVRPFLLDHREGALLECIQSLEAELGEPVIEVYVLAADPNGQVPVQLVTASMLKHPL